MKEQASACFGRNDGVAARGAAEEGVDAGLVAGAEAFEPTPSSNQAGEIRGDYNEKNTTTTGERNRDKTQP